MLEFRILGPLEVLRDGVVVPLAGQKQRALLAVLLLHANEVVPSERLIEELWGEDAPKTAATSLQNFVSQLRKALGTDVVETRAPGYRLKVEPDQLDLLRVERLLRDARSQHASERLRTIGDALACWRGSPLVDFSYEPFAQDEIRRIEEIRLAALEERFEAELELGHYAEIVGDLEALVREHPLRERLRAQLMRALYGAGRQGDALQQFHAARRSLVDELGIEPSPALQRVHQAILRHETSLDRAGVPTATDHYADIAKALLSGRLVPVLGPGVAPRGAPDVVEHLARSFEYPRENGSPDLPRVSQYVATMAGVGPLYDVLHELYDADLEPSDAHRFVAALAPLLRCRGLPCPLVVTTAYDLALERAFAEAGEEFDVVAYVATGRDRGRFWHLPHGGAPRLVEIPNTYATELDLAKRSVVLKLHGGVERGSGREWESFVVTEDDYIDYLAREDLSNLIPVGLTAKLRRSHFLFLGYALRDWNLRVLLNRLWGDEKVGYRSWAVQPEAPPLEVEFWRKRDVDVFELEVDEFVDAFDGRLAELPA